MHEPRMLAYIPPADGASRGNRPDYKLPLLVLVLMRYPLARLAVYSSSRHLRLSHV